ncbi:glycosyltransferase [Desulfosoma sp.]
MADAAHSGQLKVLEDSGLKHQARKTVPLWKQFLKGSPPKDKGLAQGHSASGSRGALADQKGEFAPHAVRMGYTVAWDTQSFESLRRHYRQLTHVCAEWLTIADPVGTLAVTPDARVQDFTSTHGLHLMLLLTNWANDAWLPEGVEALANGPAERRDRFLEHLVTAVRQAGARGIVVDWNELDPAYRDRIAALLLETARRLHQQGAELWLSVPMGKELKAFDLRTLASGIDRFIAVLHDEHGEGDEPGPIASRPWVEGWLQVVTRHGRPSQWIVQLGNYGYDWAEGDTKAQTLSFADAMARASIVGVEQLFLDRASENPGFSYEEDGRRHSVWFLDAVTFWNQLLSVQSYHPGGVALYRLGTEDPGVWSVLASVEPGPLRTAASADLRRISADASVAIVGKGNFLTVSEGCEDGRRALQMDRLGRLWETYERFPRSLTLIKRGAGQPEEVAISFDDGPDPKWTPKILDVLKKHGVKASFFVVGLKVEKNPELLRRIVAEGHEVGIHTYTHPNLGEVSEERVKVELNATRRLIETVTGHSTILFRPPYNADGFPQSLEEIAPIRLAQSMGYVTVSDDVDPEDWSLPGALAIFERVKRERRLGGNVVLLHDAGGDRGETVEALSAILDYLEKRGDRIVPLSSLLQRAPVEVMPPLVGRSPLSQQVSLTGFHVLLVIKRLFWSFVAVATALVVLRSFLVVALAWRHRRRQRELPSAPFHPPVSVLIAAYNEAKVIQDTLASVVESDYPNELEVVVVDDGSRDETAELVAAMAAKDPRIRLLRQANRGKAAALARGLAAVRQDIVVTLDADTRFRSDTIRRLVEPFADRRVAAVSGQARVGNQRSFLARCQALEYQCGFHLDRRAYDLLHCITVVPGAVSALRKSAVIEAGGFSSDTLAEDTDLTLSLHRLRRSVVYVPEAVAWTEVPETLRGLVKQRFRWAFGTFQCLWKHKDMLFHPRYGTMGLLGLPNVWFFQILLVALTPILDALCLISFVFGPSPMLVPAVMVFLLMDLTAAVAACWIDGEPLRRVWLIVPMRWIYRPILGWVVWRSFYTAVKGAWVRWGKVDRTAAFDHHLPGVARG